MDEFGQLDPAVIAREFATKWREQVFKRDSRWSMWKVLCSLSAEVRQSVYILDSVSAQIHCGARLLPFFKRT